MSLDKEIERIVLEVEVITLKRVIAIFEEVSKKVDCERKIRRILEEKIQEMENHAHH